MMMVEEHDLSTLTGLEGHDDHYSVSEVTDYFDADLASLAQIGGWVFWRSKRDQHSEFDVVEEKIKIVLRDLGFKLHWKKHYMVQFWAAKVEGQHHYLTTSDQPFSLGCLAKGLCWYRKLCMDEPIDGQLLGPVGRVHWNKRPETSPDLRLYSTTEFPLRDDAAGCGFRQYLALPVFGMCNDSELYGVLEILVSGDLSYVEDEYLILSRGLEKVAMLRSTHLYYQHHKQKPENEITEILKFASKAVPQLHLAQVWIPCKQCDDKTGNFICMERTDYVIDSCNSVGDADDDDMHKYLYACNFHNLQIRKEITGYFHKNVCDTSISENPLAHYQQKGRLSLCFTVPLVSVHNSNDVSVVEFFLHPNHSEYACADSLMVLLLRMMEKELKSFKFSKQFAEKLAVESSQPDLIKHGCSELNMLKEMKPNYESYSESDFIERFQLTDLNCIRPSEYQNGWVFYSPDKDEQSENYMNSNSSHAANLIKRKIKVLMIEIASPVGQDDYTLVQFWAPKLMEDGRRCLAVSQQPYALACLSKGSALFRKQCMEHHYYIDEKAKEEELGPPGRVFRNGCPEISNDLRLYSIRDFSLRNHATQCAFQYYLALPVFDLGRRVGVLEFLADRDSIEATNNYVKSMSDCLKAANLGSTCIISHPDLLASHLPHSKVALAEFKAAFQLIKEIPQLYMTEVWIPGGCACIDSNLNGGMELVFCDPEPPEQSRLLPLVQTKRGIAGAVLASENKCCFCQHLCDLSIVGQHFEQVNRLDVCFAICLKNSHTGDLPYVIQFYLNQGPATDEYLKSFLKFLLPIMKQKLKSFRVASGKQLGEELVVEVICFSDTDKLTFPELHWQADTFSVEFKLVDFDQKNHQHAQHISGDNEFVESGRQAGECSAASENPEREDETKKTEKRKENTGLQLNIEDLEPHFGKRLDDVAKELGVGRSTIKRVLRKHDISRWPNNKKYKKNPSLFMKEKAREIARYSQQNTQPSSSGNHPTPDMRLQQIVPQTNTGSTQNLNNQTEADPALDMPLQENVSEMSTGSAQNLNYQAEAEQVIVKVKYKNDTIKFQLCLSSGIEKIVEEVARRLHLEKGSFKLKYVDDDNDKILLACDDDLQFVPTSVAAAGKAYIQLFVESNR